MQIAALDEAQTFGDSMLEEIRRTAEERLHQIEPLLEEAQRLRDVLEVLNRRSAAASESEPVGEGTRRTAPRSSRLGSSRPEGSGSSERRAAKGSNKRAIMELVASMPGITAAEISDLTGMKRTVVASTVSRLKRYGELLDHETGGVCVPSAAAPIAGPQRPQKPTGVLRRGKHADSAARRLATPAARQAA
jgi:hypothetical protein